MQNVGRNDDVVRVRFISLVRRRLLDVQDLERHFVAVRLEQLCGLTEEAHRYVGISIRGKFIPYTFKDRFRGSTSSSTFYCC